MPCRADTVRLGIYLILQKYRKVCLWKGSGLASRSPIIDINSVNWEEMRTAYTVGELRTLSRTAQYLGVHRTTIMRHIRSLEKRLGRRVFERERDGYHPTAFGNELITVTRQVAKDFHDFTIRRRSHEVAGTGCVHIAAPGYMACIVTAVIAKVQEKHPDLHFAFSATHHEGTDIVENADILLTLYDVAIENYFTQKLTTLRSSLFASSIYEDKRGIPHSLRDVRDHKFVCDCSSRRDGGAGDWLRKYVPATNIAFRSTSKFALYSAIEQGVGIGFMPTQIGLTVSNLIQVLEPSSGLEKQVWVSTRQQPVNGQKILVTLKALRAFF